MDDEVIPTLYQPMPDFQRELLEKRRLEHLQTYPARARDGRTIIETTTPREKYFGFVLTSLEAQQFEAT